MANPSTPRAPQQPETSSGRPRGGRPPTLSPQQQRSILRKWICGWRADQLALELCVSTRTIERTVQRYRVSRATTVEELFEIEGDEPELQDPQPAASQPATSTKLDERSSASGAARARRSP
jgi:hypothetical protein